MVGGDSVETDGTGQDVMLQRLNTSCESYIEAEERSLLTLNWKCVGRKPA